MTAIYEVQQVEKLMAGGAQIVEVLPRDSYDEQHLPGAISIPLAELPGRSDELDRDRPVVVYCWDTQCDLSPRAAALLTHLGFGDVHDFVTGKLAWMSAGMPTDGDKSAADRVASVARSPATCGIDDDLAGIGDRLQEHGLCVVIDGQRIVLGEVRQAAVGDLPGESAVADVMEAAPRTIRPSVPRTELIKLFSRSHDLDHVLVTTLAGELVGVIHRD